MKVEMSGGACTLLGLAVSTCPTHVFSDTDTTTIHIITLNYVIFSNYYQCLRVSVSVCVVFGVCVSIRAS